MIVNMDNMKKLLLKNNYIDEENKKIRKRNNC